MLNKQAAAEFLAISVRSLERYTNQGRVSAHYLKGRSRPVPWYEEGDLNTLKAELDLVPLPSAKPLPASEPISFRMDAHYLSRLDEEGRKRGMSAGAYARLLVIDALEEGACERLRADIAELRRLTGLLGEDLANAVLALLVHGGRIEQEAEARDWVLSNLRAAGGRRKS